MRVLSKLNLLFVVKLITLVIIVSTLVHLEMDDNAISSSNKDNLIDYGKELDYPLNKYNFNNNWGTSYQILSDINQINDLAGFCYFFLGIHEKKGKSEDLKLHLRPNVIHNGELIVRDNIDPELIHQNIKGKTLEVYYYIIQQNKDVGVREIQRAFDYSSSGLAAYHLNRLVDFNIITKNENNRYQLTNLDIKLGNMKNQILIGNHWIPRYYFTLAILLILTLIAFTLFVFNANQVIWSFTLIPLLSLSTIFIGLVERNSS